MRAQDLEQWINHPVTKLFKQLVDQHLNANVEVLQNAVRYAKSLKDVDLGRLEQYRGQIYTLELVSDLNNFMKEVLHRETTQEDIKKLTDTYFIDTDE